MFEKYLIDDLYYCTVQDMVPLGITNFGGAISIESVNNCEYETIVCLRNGKYYDINNLYRVLNVVNCPQMHCPLTSNDNHLYILLEDTLVPYREKNNTSHSVLQRLPFGKTRYIK